jgi:coenzyme Q-binding protein COQ10
MSGASRSIVIAAPPEKIFDVIADFEKYPQYLSEVKSVKVLNRKGNELEAHFEVDLVKRIKYALKVKEERPTRLSWTYISGDFMKDNQGSWVLEPQADGKTKVTYAIEVKLGPLVPKAIVNTMVESSLPKMLEATKQRVERQGA